MSDLTSDFPRERLLDMIGMLLSRADEAMVMQAIAAYDALSDRYVLDTTELKAEVGTLRAELKRVSDELRGAIHG